MKYWILACRLQLVKENKDPNKLNKQHQLISNIGIVINLIAGIAYGSPTGNSFFYFLGLVIQISIIVSCIFLADAFRRLKKVQENDQVIDKGPVILLFFSFGAYGVSILLMIPNYSLKVSKLYINVDIVMF